MPYSNSKSRACLKEAAKDSKDKRIVMLLILTGILMFVIDGSVVNIALPTITAYFQTDVAQSQWVVTSYLLAQTSLLMVFGKVSEYTGRMRLFISGFAIFTLASLACGLSPNLEVLILSRVIQAIGAAMAFSISAAVIFEIYPISEQGKAMGYIGTTVSLGSIAGPMIGGYFVNYFGWEYIFLINLPIGIVLLALSSKYMRLEESKSDKLEVDWIGAVMMIVFVVSLMMLLDEIARSFSLYTAAWALATFTSLAIFIANESRHKAPLLDLSVLKIREFLLPNITVALFIISIFAVFILGPFYFQGVMGYTPAQVGTVFLIIPMIMSVGAPVGGWIYDKYHYKYNSALGMIIVAASLALVGFATRTMDIHSIIFAFALMGIGNALFQSPINTEIMSALPKSKIGTASSLSSALRNLAMAIGVSASSILLTIQLGMAGYYGPVLNASPNLLSVTISNVMIAAAALCTIGIVTAALRNHEPA